MKSRKFQFDIKKKKTQPEASKQKARCSEQPVLADPV